MRRTNTTAVEDPPRRCARECVGAPRPSQRMLSREIGVLLLILAAQTIMGVVNMDGALSTELMAESESFHGRPSLNNKNYAYSSSYYSSASSAEKEMPYVDVSEGMSSSGTSSGTSESTDEDRDEEDVVAARLASRLTTPRRTNRVSAQDEAVWESIFSLLPWEAATQARELSQHHFGDARARVTIARMPQSKTAAVFIPCLEDLDGDEMAVEAELAPRGAGGAGGASDGQRLFLGQLRRTGTVPMVRWLVNTVFNAPPGALVSVENRRNTRTQRGKGCAWATINDAATVERMLGAHHRLFFDTVDGVEGVWLVPEGHEDALLTEVSLRGDEGGAHAKHMPRGTIVVEVPSTTAPAVPAAMSGPMGGAWGAHSYGGAPRGQPLCYGGAVPAYGAAAPAYGCEAPRWSAGMPCPPYAMCNAMPPPQPQPMVALPRAEARFAPYRVPGADFVQPGTYRHNPYTAMVQ